MSNSITTFKRRLRRKALVLLGGVEGPRPGSVVPGGPPGPPVRAEYKRVWNSVSVSEDDAKVAVAGYTDETTLTNTALGTKRMLEEMVGLSKEDVILEIGAGVGRVGAVLAPVCKKWIGADVSENMVEHMKRRLAHFPNVEAVPLSGYDLAGIASSSIDVVYCTVVFMHLDEWDRFGYVQEAFRVLRPGGRILVNNFNLTSDDGWAFFVKNRNDYSPLNRPPNISKSSTPVELETYLRRAGFLDVRIKEDFTWVIASGRKA